MSIRLERLWYRRHPLGLVLAPLAWSFCAVAGLRRMAYRSGLIAPVRLPLPVLVAGNVTVGGTGKTPFVVWLAEFLLEQGYSPGIVASGYGGRARHWPQQVRPDSDPYSVGDEAVLLARRTGVPVAASRQRADAARLLMEHSRCDVLVCDDGLQHLRLHRDLEIALVDGVRRLGNGRCLPAGPLRERPSRLGSVDLVVCNGLATGGEFAMRISPGDAVSLTTGERRAVGDFAGKKVHAVAGIAYPERFFAMLRRLGLSSIEHRFPDHHAYRPGDLDFGDELPVMMTEKDAVKCERYARAHHWYLPIRAELPAALKQRLRRLLWSVRRTGDGQDDMGRRPAVPEEGPPRLGGQWPGRPRA